MGRVRKIANVAFVAIIACALFSVIGYIVIQQTAPAMQRPAKSQLEGRNYQELPELSFDSFESRNFQTGFSKYIADEMPFRNEVVISNATVQRKAIEIANAFFSYETYPTFFGSSYLYTPSTGQVTEGPFTISDKSDETLSKAAQAWTKLIEANPQINWLLVLPDRAVRSSAAPGHSLVANAADRTYMEDKLFTKLPINSTYVDVGYNDANERSEAFFKTDHHWQIQGAYAAYAAIAKKLGVEPINEPSFYKADTGTFYGSGARMGLCFPESGDEIWDISYDASDIKVYIDGAEKSIGDLSTGAVDPTKTYRGKTPYSNLYSGWFHSDYGLIELENSSCDNDKSLLIIGDSYTNNMERLFAENFRKVVVVDPRSCPVSLRTIIDENHFEDAVILLSNVWDSDVVLDYVGGD